MAFRLWIAPLAERSIDSFAAYLRDYSETLAVEQIERLDRALSDLSEAPFRWSYFPLTGPPYRASLFRVGRKTQRWIVYRVNEPERRVDVLHFWSPQRDPESFSL